MKHLKKQDDFRKEMDKLITLNLEVIADSTEYIQLDDNTVVSENEFILEFYNNCSLSITKAIQDRFTQLAEQAGTGKEHIVCGNENCGKEFDTQITFDYANFFA